MESPSAPQFPIRTSSTMNAKLAKAIVLLLAAGIAVLVAMFFSSDRSVNVSIICQGSSTNSMGGIVSLLELRNSGSSALVIDPYCTIYWTNRLNAPTNLFYPLRLSDPLLKPGKSCRVSVSPPLDAQVWQTSFGFSAEPSLLDQFWEKCGIIAPNWLRSDSVFHGFLGPFVTNSPVK